MTDRQLLIRFVERHDDVAFEALVHLHGSMVFGVCRRVLGNHHDAEEAFQATFLVLARKADSISRPEALSNWLYGVALRTSLKAKAIRSNRQQCEEVLAELPDVGTSVDTEWWPQLVPILDQEVGRLPEKYRVPVVLCDLEGKSHQEAARQLGCPEGTLSSRLMRARTLLQKRMARHGLMLPTGVLGVLMVQNSAQAAVAGSVMDSVVKAAQMPGLGRAAIEGVISTNAATLTEGVLKAMSLTNLKTLIASTAATIAIPICVGGMIYTVQQTQSPAVVIAQDQPNAQQATTAAQNESLTETSPERLHALVDGQMRLIGVALQDYQKLHDGRFPPAVKYRDDQQGKPIGHSWRVAILPMLGEGKLYSRYNFNEPWDSESNKKLLAEIPSVYRHPKAGPESTNTTYFALVGQLAEKSNYKKPLETGFSHLSGFPISEMWDGTSNTIAIVEADRDIPWTKPEDIPYNPKNDLPQLGGYFSGGFHAVCFDSHAFFVERNTSRKSEMLIRQLISPQGGEVIDR